MLGVDAVAVAIDARMDELIVRLNNEDCLISRDEFTCPDGVTLVGDLSESTVLPQARDAFALVSDEDFQGAPSPDQILPVYLQGTKAWKKQHER